MEKAVIEPEFVVLVCTPDYAIKANNRQGGAGYENSIVTGELFAKQSSSKFISILRSGSLDMSLLSYLKSRICIDFTKDSLYQSNLEILIHKLYKVPILARPPLGAKPEFSTSHQSDTISYEPKQVIYCTSCGVLTGSKTRCTTLSGYHNFTSSNSDVENIYCATCGAKVGKASSCTTLLGYHNFRV